MKILGETSFADPVIHKSFPKFLPSIFVLFCLDKPILCIRISIPSQRISTFSVPLNTSISSCRFRGSFTWSTVVLHSALRKSFSHLQIQALPRTAFVVASLEALSCFIPHCGNRSVTLSCKNSYRPYCHKVISLSASGLKQYFVLNAF